MAIAKETIAEKTAERSSRRNELGGQIRDILATQAHALDPAMIDFLLKDAEIKKGRSISDFDTYKVRDALLALERAGQIEFTSLGEIRLIEK